jgi:hypothetical protein
MPGSNALFKYNSSGSLTDTKHSDPKKHPYGKNEAIKDQFNETID